jgi:hypothetical protein
MPKRAKKIKVKIIRAVKGALVKGYLEKVDRKAFEYLLRDFRQLLGDSSGIYALYNGDKLYYVGIADNLLARVDWHTQDRHQNNWDKVSFFIIDKHRYSKDIETTILRIIKTDTRAEPKGNRTRGKFEAHYKLQDQLIAKRRQLKEIAHRL